MACRARARHAGDCLAGQAVAAVSDYRGPDRERVRIAAALSELQDGHEMPDRRRHIALDIGAQRLVHP